MKKSLVALAALAVAGVASAQSSVTLFGVLDSAVSYTESKSENAFGGSVKQSQWAQTTSGYNSSRLGFRGTEDLGGGLAASFWLETGINTDNGTGATSGNPAVSGNGLTFSRRSTVSLSGAFGEARIGRDITPTYWNDSVFDPFGGNGVGTNLISTANGFSSSGAITNGFTANSQYARANNTVGYFLPSNLGGFYGQVMYAMNEQVSYDPGTVTPPGAAAISANPALLAIGNNARAGRYVGGRVGYANGPLDVALAYGASTVTSNFYRGITQNLDTWNVGASYDFGVVKLFGEYSDAKLKNDVSTLTLPGVFGVSDPRAKGWLLGATVPVGPGLIRVAYSVVDYSNTLGALNQVFGVRSDPSADKFAIGYVHNLSKRTALYATLARVNNKDGADLTTGVGNTNFTRGTINGGILTPKNATGYDFGIRHVF